MPPSHISTHLCVYVYVHCDFVVEIAFYNCIVFCGCHFFTTVNTFVRQPPPQFIYCHTKYICDIKNCIKIQFNQKWKQHTPTHAPTHLEGNSIISNSKWNFGVARCFPLAADLVCYVQWHKRKINERDCVISGSHEHAMRCQQLPHA